MKGPTTREKLRYAFDSFMARGTAALILGLAVVSAVVVVVVALFVSLSGSAPEGMAFHRVVWWNLLRTLDSGTMGGDAGTAPFLGAMLVVTIGGIFVVSALIGVLSAGLDDKLAELRKGRSRVLEKDHTVILGWSQQVFPILSELIEANSSRKKAAVVILADKDKIEMEEEIKDRMPETRTTKIVCRRGSPIDMSDIDIASVQTSRSIIVLSQEHADPDAEVLKSLLAIVRDPDRRPEPYNAVCELRDRRNVDVAKMVAGDEAEIVLADDLIARITAQTCRQSGLSVVYTELLDFAGDEIYHAPVGELAGRSFGEALMGFADATVIGIDNGKAQLNPPMEGVLKAEDKLLVIASDDDKITPARTPAAIDESAIVAAPASEGPPRPERTLVLGWNRRAERILVELDNYVAPGSEIVVVAEGAHPVELRNCSLRIQDGDTTDRATLEKLDPGSFDHIIVLCYPIEVQQADARTLFTLLHLRDIAGRTGARFSMVSEMLDLRNRALAEVARADDFIVSDRLISLVTTQIAENPSLNAVFQDLFDADGSEIYLRLASDYVQTDRPVSFATVVESARRRQEVAIGYRALAQAAEADSGYGVRVNPPKHAEVRFAPGDRVIVLAED